MAASSDVLKTLKDKEVKFVDLRFTDTRGKEQHVQVPAKQFTQDKFDNGHAFDGSSIAGWKGIEDSDMVLMPDADSARIDPFTDETTLNITRDVVQPPDGRDVGHAGIPELPVPTAFTHALTLSNMSTNRNRFPCSARLRETVRRY